MKWPLIGVAAAIAITTTMDATGFTAFSALPLCPLLALFWYLERFSRVEIGITWGRPRDYGLAVLYPLAVLGTDSTTRCSRSERRSERSASRRPPSSGRKSAWSGWR